MTGWGNMFEDLSTPRLSVCILQICQWTETILIKLFNLIFEEKQMSYALVACVSRRRKQLFDFICLYTLYPLLPNLHLPPNSKNQHIWLMF